MQPISLSALWQVLHNLQAHDCPYLLGAKAPSLDCDTEDVHQIDYSGFVRYAVARATGGALILPDGSANQRDWCIRQMLHKAAYPDAATLADSSRLFIAFITATAPGQIGHVWLLNGGKTLESHGHHGPDSRPWDTPVLAGNVSACYELQATA